MAGRLPPGSRVGGGGLGSISLPTLPIPAYSKPTDEQQFGTSRFEVVAKEQQFLKNRGYNLVVDGKRGHKTMSALEDWHRGVGKRNPLAWTQKNAPYDDVRPAQTNANNQLPVKGQKPADTQPDIGTTKGVETGKGKPNLPPGPASNRPTDRDSSSLFDADVIANAQMEAKYGPVLAEYMRQEALQRAIGDNRVAELGDMYGTLVEDIEGRNTASADLRTKLVKATTGLAPAIASGIALDPTVAAELAARGDIESDYAEQMNQSASDYDSRMASAAEQGGVFAQGQARADATGKIDKLGAEKLDVLAQKGADFVSARQALIQWQEEQKFAKQKLTAEMNESKIRNRVALAELEAANKMLPLELQKTQAELDKLAADIANINADTEATLNPSSDPMKEDEYARNRNKQILNDMFIQTRAEGGAWRVPLGATWLRAKAALAANGINPESKEGKWFLRNYAVANGITLDAKGNPISRLGEKKKK